MVSHQCAESVRLLATEPGLEQELKGALRNHPDAEVLLSVLGLDGPGRPRKEAYIEALADCLRDEPEWRHLLRIEEIELLRFCGIGQAEI